MEYVIFHEKCASFSLAMESVILQKARLKSIVNLR